MKYEAEVFDKFQYLAEIKKFNDHQLHCVIRFEDKLNADIMGKAMLLLHKVIPILSCEYKHNNGDAYWKSISPSQFKNVFVVVNNETEFNRFTSSKTNELVGPQIKACLFQSTNDSLSIIMNHMICDAAGFKQCLYLLSDLYSKLMEDPHYSPEYVISGDRSFQKINSGVRFWDSIKIILAQNKDSNQKSISTFPLSQDENTAPFILTHEISSTRFAIIHNYCKTNNVTVNDVALTAYYRVLSKILNMDGKVLDIPIMVDMRKYLENKNFDSLSNLSSIVITRIAVKPSESFEDTLSKVNREMNMKKANQIGMNGFVKLNLICKLFSKKRSYEIIRSNLNNPYICMTNIGILDSKKLVFKGSSIMNAFVCGSIKYRPYFQMALSSFAGKITFSSNLYGSKQDRDTILHFFSLLDAELPQ